MPRKPPPAPRTKREMTPVAVTELAGEPARPVAARSLDETWLYRLQPGSIGGTVWVTVHAASGIAATSRRNLPDARAATADGRALKDVERVQAHLRGEHASRRDMMCLSC